MFAISRLLLSLSLLAACAAPLSAADELLVAPEDAPQYELTGIRRETDRFGSPVLVIDYKLVRKETRPMGSIRIAGKTKNGELIGFSVQRLENSGQLRVGLRGMLWGESDYEIYLVIDACIAATPLEEAGDSTKPVPAPPDALNGHTEHTHNLKR